MTISFVTGGARSGKSRFAEQLAEERAGSNFICYVATGVVTDDEMKARISVHQTRRGTNFVTVEEPHNVANQIRSSRYDVFLVDCLAFLLNNWMYDLNCSEREFQQRVDELCAAITESKKDIIIVSNEVGLGLVPMSKESRLYRDWLGWMNQAVASVSDEVYLVVAGYAVNLKQIPGVRIVE